MINWLLSACLDIIVGFNQICTQRQSNTHLDCSFMHEFESVKLLFSLDQTSFQTHLFSYSVFLNCDFAIVNLSL